jgi:hypothetical protein
MSSSTSTPETGSSPARTSFWSDVAHALKGEQHDYTAESLNRATLLLAVPMVLEMLMESLFAVVDVFWVSRLGRDAVAVIGLTESVMSWSTQLPSASRLQLPRSSHVASARKIQKRCALGGADHHARRDDLRGARRAAQASSRRTSCG